MEIKKLEWLGIILGIIGIIYITIPLLQLACGILTLLIGLKLKRQNSNLAKTNITIGTITLSLFVIIIIMKLILGFNSFVIIESCSMYHNSNLDNWWVENSQHYQEFEVTKQDFESFPFKNGFSKGDLLISKKISDVPEIGDIIIFRSVYTQSLAHRVVSIDPISTKGDKNPIQLDGEKTINQEDVTSKAILRIPLIGWTTIIFYESRKVPQEKGFCS